MKDAFILQVEEAPSYSAKIRWPNGEVPSLISLFTGEMLILAGKYPGGLEHYRYRRAHAVYIGKGDVLN